MDPLAWLVMAASVAVPLLLAVVVHETAHGVMALACGDDTARRAGRLTLNPIPHVDIVGTVAVPAVLALMPWLVGGPSVLFGWAKPVPVDPSRFRSPRRDEILVAVAGPAANLLLALASALALAGLGPPARDGASRPWLATMAATSLHLNCVLAVFNLLPFPPLDGGRVLSAMLPQRGRRILRSLESLGLVLVLLVVLNTPLLGVLVRPLVGWLLGMAR